MSTLLPHKKYDDFIRKYNKEFAIKGYSKMTKKEKNDIIISRLKTLSNKSAGQKIRSEFATMVVEHKPRGGGKKKTPAPKKDNIQQYKKFLIYLQDKSGLGADLKISIDKSIPPFKVIGQAPNLKDRKSFVLVSNGKMKGIVPKYNLEDIPDVFGDNISNMKLKPNDIVVKEGSTFFKINK